MCRTVRKLKNIRLLVRHSHLGTRDWIVCPFAAVCKADDLVRRRLRNRLKYGNRPRTVDWWRLTKTCRDRMFHDSLKACDVDSKESAMSGFSRADVDNVGFWTRETSIVVVWAIFVLSVTNTNLLWKWVYREFLKEEMNLHLFWYTLECCRTI